MRPGIHPEYRPVVFEDSIGGQQWLCGSAIQTDRTIVLEDGKECPHVLLDISSSTHPFSTGTMQIVDSAGRVERFDRRYGRRTTQR